MYFHCTCESDGLNINLRPLDPTSWSESICGGLSSDFCKGEKNFGW